MSGRTAEDTVGKSAEKGGVAAVNRALSIVEALVDAAAPLTLSELSRRTALYKSTSLRLLESLEQMNFVTRLQDTSYTLGPMAWRMGDAYARSSNLESIVGPVLQRLVAQGTESASFHVLMGDNARLCLLRVDSAHSTLDSVRQGQVLPLVGAAGEVLRRIAQEGPAGFETETLRSFGERDSSCAGIARAVFGPKQRPLGALSLSGPIERFTPEAVARMTSLLDEAVAALRKKLTA